ncbi:MAG TPA: response regulator [Actinocatenispora sp.]
MTAARRPDTPGRVLVVDDDPDIVRFVEMNLRFEGFDVAVAVDGVQALAEIGRYRPDLVLLDVMMPDLDGVEVTRRIRADPLTAGLPVIMLTAKGLGADRVAGLTAGADDYIIKPFDTLELVARVRSTLRRNREMRESSPLTGLPGNARILREIADRVRHDERFALCYVDVDRFKSVNDAYGFVRGDEFISLLAHVLYESVTAVGTPVPFLGHVGGDDFLVLCQPGQVDPVTEHAIAAFESRVTGLYDPADAAAGHLRLPDRRGKMHTYALVTLSVGVASSRFRRYDDAREVVAVATEMKQVAKSHAGSYVAVDRRRNRPDT